MTQMVFDYIQSKFFLIMSYWAEENDELIFIEIKQPQNNIEVLDFTESHQFKSEIDKNLLNLFNQP